MNQEIFRFGDLLNLIKSLKYDENNISYPTYGNSADGNTSFGITCNSLDFPLTASLIKKDKDASYAVKMCDFTFEEMLPDQNVQVMVQYLYDDKENIPYYHGCLSNTINDILDSIDIKFSVINQEHCSSICKALNVLLYGKLVEDYPEKWFVRQVNTGILPTVSQLRHSISSVPITHRDKFNRIQTASRIRSKYIKLYGYSLLNQELIDDMVKFFDGKRILEVGCGSAYLAAELQKRGVDIKVTDNFAWEDFFKHKYIDIEKIDGVEAVKKYGKEYDYVLMSFPEYSSPFAYNILKVCMEMNIDLIYIGEDQGGCTADDDFFELLETVWMEMEYDVISENYVRFEGMYDYMNLIRIRTKQKGLVDGNE